MTNAPALFTLKMLTDAKACSEQVALFKRTFGKSVDVANPPEGFELLPFDWKWGTRFLDAPGWATYEKARAPAWATYEKAVAPAWATYEKARVPAWATYEKAVAPAWATYEKAVAPAWATYEKARASAWVAGYVATVRRAQGVN